MTRGVCVVSRAEAAADRRGIDGTLRCVRRAARVQRRAWITATAEFNSRVYAIAHHPARPRAHLCEIAERLGDKLLAREVGLRPAKSALRSCHRVLAAGGKTGGFSAGGGVVTKLRLLTIEGAQPSGPTLFDKPPWRADGDVHRRGLRLVNQLHELVQAGPGGPRGYHHGNLKEALIRAALELIAQKGPAGFTFAEAARWAGVSPAAPYRHFRDRDELLANVARRGFEEFEQTLARAWDNGRPDPMTALDRFGKAYLAFARKEPAYYSAMFEGVRSIPIRCGRRREPRVRAARRSAGVLMPPKRLPALMVGCTSGRCHGIARCSGAATPGARCRCRRRNC
jgi:AcrR family transcriptional regulator